MTMSIQSPHWNRLFQRLSLLAIIFSALMLNIGMSRAQTSPPSRPILFVHGICDTSVSWAPLETSLINYVTGLQPSLYTNSVPWTVYYDTNSQTVKTWPNGQDFLTTVPSSTRFFSINLFDPSSTDFSSINPVNVAQVSILNKGDEIAHVIQAITTLTRVKDVIVIGHSQGGLDARAYIENLAIPYYWSICSDQNGYACFATPRTYYTQDISKLITLDTPQSGAETANWASWLPSTTIACWAEDTLNRRELQDTSLVVNELTGNAANAPSGLTIASIQSYTSPGFAPSGGPDGDEVVTFQEQSIHAIAPSVTNYYDVPDYFGSYFPFYLPPNTILSPLHLLNIVGAEPTTTNTLELEIDKVLLHGTPAVTTSIAVQVAADVSYTISGPTTLSGTGPNTFYGMPVGTYTISYPGGSLQQTLGVDHSTGTNNWNLTFNISSSSGTSPTVITSPATVIGSDGANLNGTVNPNGSAVTAWFEYGTSSALNTFQSTSPVQSIPSGTTSVPVIYGLSYQSANTQFYYRLAVSNGATTTRGTILNFTTLNTLPPPTLLTPGNSSTGASLTPQFSWTAVSGATSGYRVMMSTNMSSLPTDPNSDACSAGCLLGSTGATTSGTAFTPSAGELSSSTTYYWEVHGRSPTQAGAWSSPIWSFTTGAAVSNDFSIQVSPSAQSVSQGSSLAYNVVTATSSGTGQNIALSALNVPSGLSATFSPTSVTSGSQSTLTITASASAPVGTYTLVIAAASSYTTHTYQISVTVAQTQTGPVMTVTPSIVRFNDQSVGTISSPQTVVLRNSGSGQLIITGIGLASGNTDYALNLSGFSSPLILNQGVTYSLPVYFEPASAGTRPGQIVIYDNASGSPQIVSLTGNGLAAQPTTGTINVNATLNGVALPALYYYQYSLNGPTTVTSYDNNSFSVTAGSYSIAFQNNPSNFGLSSVTPSASQTVAAGGTATFTLNFTAPDDFYGPTFMQPPGGGFTPQIIPVGSTATYYVDVAALVNNASTPIKLLVVGAPSSSIPTFNPEPMYSGTGGTLTIGTTPGTTPPGVYSLTLSGTNVNGITHAGNSSALAITTPPATPVQLVSQSSSGSQANSGGTVASNSVSANGRLVVFSSTSTNLAPGATAGNPEVYVRDLQASTTTLVSVSNSGAVADSWCYRGSISDDGNFVEFSSLADNLYPGSVLNAVSGIYVRDLTHGATEREDLAPDGTPSNGNSTLGVISGDGRFVAFISTATNLVSGGSGTQAYLRDRKTSQTVLISSATDGTPANGSTSSLAISADGRYVGFVSNATNLVSANTSGLYQAFVRDMVNGTTSLVSAASSGIPANSSVIDDAGAYPPAISADGRYIAFSSYATNLVPQPTDGISSHNFVYDRQTQKMSLVDVDSVGTPLGGTSYIDASMSIDGRFIAFYGFDQVLVRDTAESQTAIVSLAAGGEAGNNSTWGWNIGLGGSRVAFASTATNLVSNDLNGQADAFVGSNPFVGNVSLNSLSIESSSASGGRTLTGTVSLTSAAPAEGAAVSVWSNNGAAQPPAVVTVPAGATSASFSFSTSLVPSETVMTIMAAYNGGSGVAVLTLEPAPELAVSPETWDFGYQAVGTTSAIESFALTNSGTAPLAFNSVQLATGQVFKISANTCGSSIAAGGGCSVSVTFDPSASGSASDAVQVSYGSPATTFSISLTGNGANPLATLAPAPLSFGNQSMPGSSTAVATLTNSGDASLSNISSSISGTNAGDFSISSDGCSGVILPANSNCLIVVSFSPKAKGSRVATLSIADSASGSPQTTSLSGAGVQSTPTVQWSPLTASLAYGTPLGSGVLDATASLNGSNVVGTFAYTASLNGGTPQVVTQATKLVAGSYILSSTFTPTDTTDYTTATGTVHITVNAASPTVTVTPSASSITTSQPLTVTVAVNGGSGNPIPTGTVTLTGGGYTSVTTSLSSGGATINIPANSLGAGTDSLAVSYTPDSSSSSTYNSASGSATVTVTTPAKTTPTVTVTPSASSITTAQPLKVTIAVSGGTGNPTPTGSVILTGGGYNSGATTLSSGSATINIPANSLGAGTDSLSVSYTPSSSSSSTYNSASGSVSVTVATPAKTTPTVSVTPSASSVTTAQTLSVTVAVNGGTGNPTPTGSVTLTGGGYTSGARSLSGGRATINIPANSLSAGTDSLSVIYTPDSSSSSTYNSAAGSATVTVTTPAKITPTVTATPSASSVTTAQALTMTVAVNGGSGNPTPTGSVTLSSGSYSAQQTLANGTANFTIAAGTLGDGANTLTASYSGDATYAGASSTTSVTVEPVSISTSVPSPVNPGSSTTSTVTLTGSGGYSGTMNLTCSLISSPVGAQSLPTCALNPASVTLASSGSGTSTLTLNTTGASTAGLARPTNQHLWKLGGGGTVLAALLLFGIPFRRRRWISMLTLLLLFAIAGAIGCGGGVGTSGGGGGGLSTPATTAGNYSFAVSATDSANAKITASTAISVTVQ